MKKLLGAFILAAATLGLMVLIAEAAGPVVDLDAGEEDFRVVGVNALDFLGEVTSGDINNDGLDDLIIGASGYARSPVPADDNAGAVYVIWGTSDRLSGTTNLDTTPADLTVYGAGGGFYLGRYVAAGDINDDGVDDLLMGADGADTDGYTDNGTVYVLFGSSSLPSTFDLYTETADLMVYGAASGDRLGRSIASCDVSGDGVGDLIIGAYQADTPGGTNAGAVYVVFGASDLSGTVELDANGADFTLLGDDAGDSVGRSVACGDVNGDGVADLIAAAYMADQAWGNDAGEVYVIYGGSGLSGTLDLNTSSPDVLLRGVAAGDQAGFYVASGDINGDGTDDVLIGAYFADVNWPNSETGTAYVVYGGSLSATMNLSETADITIYGAAENDRLSRSLTSGDFNGDGYDDILVGASRADPDTSRLNAGISYVIYGAPEITATIYLSDTNLVAVRVLGDDADDEAGRASGSGDLDGDGADDLIIGAVLAGGTDSGETYVVYGSRATTLTLSPASSTVTAGQSVTFTATASNKFGNWDITHEVNFSISPGAGGSWANNVYRSQRAGTWIVTGTFQSLVATATLTVNPGPLDHITICTDANGQNPAGNHTMTTDDTWTLYAAGFDADNNFIANQSVTWSVVGGIGTVAPTTGTSTTFDATTPGTGHVHADHPTAADDDTGTITVTRGALARVELTPEDATRTAGQSVAYTLTAYDADDNSWDVTASGVYTIEAGAGGIWAANVYTTEVAGTWIVTGTYGGRSDTATLTVTPAGTHHIVILPSSVTITAGEAQAYTAEARDAYDNFLMDVTADTTFTISPAAGGIWTANVYTSAVAGTWTVTGTYGSYQDTATLTVLAGDPFTVTVTADPEKINADGVSTSTITAFVTDRYGNPVQDGTEVIFATTLGSVTPTNVGTVNGLAQTTLTAGTEPGRATVTAAAGTASGETQVSLLVRVYLPLVVRAWSSP